MNKVDKTSQTTITIYDSDRKKAKKLNKEWLEEFDFDFNLSEFQRMCLRNDEIVEKYKQLKLKPKEF